MYRVVSPKNFPAGWDVASDIKRSVGNAQSINNILDVGGNIGQTALYLHKRFPRARIYSFEPVKNTFDILCQNTKSIPEIETFKLALGSSRRSEKILINPKHSGQNSMSQAVIEEAQDRGSYEVVETRDLDSFCQECKLDSVDILKIDVEGYELEVLKGAEGFLKDHRIKYIFSEVGFDYADKHHTNFCDLYNYLCKYNFKFYGFYDSRYWHNFDTGIIYSNALFVNTKSLS